MSTKAEIGEEIKAIRKRLQMTQEQFADFFNAYAPAHLATTRYDIANYEKGRNSMPAEKYKVFMSLEEKADFLK